jgi:hypothetical protein
VSKVSLPPHKFTLRPRWYKWLQNITYYGVMMPFNGITFPRKIVNISEVVSALTWLDTRLIKWLHCICVDKLPFLGRKFNDIHGIKLKTGGGGESPCCNRSDNRMFLFQSCYDVGCPVAVTWISVVRDQAYIVQVTFVSWYEELFITRRCCFVYIYVQVLNKCRCYIGPSNGELIWLYKQVFPLFHIGIEVFPLWTITVKCVCMK